ncbi:hypothetical protein [Actinoplanes derwentensis]|nr:hypothetical protein [Actinoplanes derwentensis]GID84450.1 hypothetical protein Ade03nite_33740 [Actinoplanes derwentensis]
MGHHRLTWTPESGIDAGGDGEVTVTDGRDSFTIPVPSGASHDPDQLIAALRHARRTALDTRAPAGPPEVTIPARLGRPLLGSTPDQGEDR